MRIVEVDYLLRKTPMKAVGYLFEMTPTHIEIRMERALKKTRIKGFGLRLQMKRVTGVKDILIA